MRRRDLITLLGGAAAWPLAAGAQKSGGVPRIGVLMNAGENDPEWRSYAAAFRDGLRKLGWVESRNIRIDYRWAAGDASRLRDFAAELVGMMPDLILAGGIAALVPLQQMTRTIPIVFAGASDPTAAGFITSLARPGGNITGFVFLEPAIGVKWLELIKEIAPRVTRVAVIYDEANPAWPEYLRAIQAGAQSLGVQVLASPVHNAAELEQTINAFAREPNSGLIVIPTPVSNFHSEQIVAPAAGHNMPAVFGQPYFVAQGGLAAYGVKMIDQYRDAAGYVDRILKGEKPGDLPVQIPTKYELLINLKTARALGLDVPLALLIRADELVE